MVSATRSGKTLENYILTVEKDRYLEILVRYVSKDDEWFLANNIEENFDQFTGTMYIETLDGRVIAKSAFKNGESYIPITGSSGCDNWIIVTYTRTVTYADGDGVLTTEFTSWTVSEFNHCNTEFEEIDILAPENDLGEVGGSGAPAPPEIPSASSAEKPCPGDPLPTVKVAAQKGSGVEGGRFGYGNRKNLDGTSKAHFGLDLEAEIGDPVSAIFGGTVNYYYEPKGLGHYAVVTSTLDGRTIYMYYGHLQGPAMSNGTRLATGDVVGYVGTSGNAKDPVDRGHVKPHVHLKVRDCSIFLSEDMHWTQCGVADPEDYISAEIDTNGENLMTDCGTIQTTQTN